MGYLGTLILFFSHFFHVLAGISVCISSTVQAQTMPQLLVGGAHRLQVFQCIEDFSLLATCCQDPQVLGTTRSPLTKCWVFLAACKNKVDEVKQHTAASAPVCVCLHHGTLRQDMFSYMKATDPAGKTFFSEIRPCCHLTFHVNSKQLFFAAVFD